MQEHLYVHGFVLRLKGELHSTRYYLVIFYVLLPFVLLFFSMLQLC